MADGDSSGRKINQEDRLDPKLSLRLKEIYGFDRLPSTISEFADMWKSLLRSQSKAVEFIEEVRAGRRMIGETSEMSGYSVVVEDGREKSVKCGLDALATTWLRGKGSIRAQCPHCGKLMEIQVEAGQIMKKKPRGRMVFFIGAGPRDVPGDPVCDHLHLFPSKEHAEAWVKDQRDELGVRMSLKEAFQLGRIFDV